MFSPVRVLHRHSHIWLRVLGGATAAFAGYVVLAALVGAGRVDASAVALLTVAAALAAFAEDVSRGVDAVLHLLLEGAGSPTPDQEAEMLEYLLANNPPPDKEPLWAVRLAEIYRRRPDQHGRADDLLDRMLLKYPTSRELQVARHHS